VVFSVLLVVMGKILLPEFGVLKYAFGTHNPESA